MKLIHRIRKSHFTKGLAMFVALNMVFEIIWPTAAMALTSGPSQPEVQSFEPVETTDMVNMFTGDFTYNLPVIYLPGPNGGYPINLAYHGGVGMDQEASWVGLGWNINAGALVRNVRGFADDYDGDELITRIDMRDNVTVGLGYGPGVELFGAGIGLNLSVRYNNYKGFAVSTGIGIPIGDNFNLGISLDSETGLGLSARMTFDGVFNESANNAYGLSYSNEGLGVSFSRSKTLKYGEEEVLEKGATSKLGTEYSFVTKDKNDDISSGSSGLGFSANAHAPVISMPMTTNSLSVSLKFGAGYSGVFANNSFNGFFNTQHIREGIENSNQPQKVYGFENYHNASKKDILDFSREKDGTLTPMTPNLPSAQLTYDVYSVLGQGISGSFRPFRTDVGRVHDPVMRNFVLGGSVAFDVGAGHLGLGGTLTMGYSVQRPWNYKNDWSSGFKFMDNRTFNPVFGYAYKDRERVYYRKHGDKSTYDVSELDFIGGMSAVQSNVDTEIMDKLDRLKVPSNIKYDRIGETISGGLEKRIPRNTLIHKFKNKELSGLYDHATITSEGDLAIKQDIAETSIFYYDWNDGQDWLPSDGVNPTNPNRFLDRRTRGEHNSDIGGQNGAYKVLNEDGQYFVYGLPAYNNKEVQSAFSVYQKYFPADETAQSASYTDFVEFGGEVKYKKKKTGDEDLNKTDNYLNKITKPPYAHSYMLTSILGADYVDIDNNGPSDNDLGYWVKMDYVKYTDNYKWRAPYQGAQYSAGALTTEMDDKGSYVYGEKELWYVSRMETKTHVLVFDLEERRDNHDAAKELSTVAENLKGDKGGLYIEKISLYLKEDYYANGAEAAVPIKEVHFQYDYSLCHDVKNNDGLNTGLPESIIGSKNEKKGKLTLRKLWFTHEGSSKGQLRPYTFNYYNEPGPLGDEIGYDDFSYDRWGNYKPDGTSFSRKYLPYVNQLNPQSESDRNASAWSLKTIHLPSGGQIDVTYEADDYSHVQSEVATQMMEITSVNDLVGGDKLLYQYHDGNINDFANPLTRRVYFKLEDPIALGLTPDQYAEKIYRDYIDKLVIDGKGDRNLYFKNYTELRPEETGSYDYVSGYVPIEQYKEDNNWKIEHEGDYHYKFGIRESSLSGGVYKEGFLTIQQFIKKSEFNETTGEVEHKYAKKYHPFSMAGWQHMKLNDPLMLTTPAGINLDDNTDSGKGAKAEIVSSLLGFVPQTIQMFSGVWHYCYRKHFARSIEVSGESVIRLTTPDRRKIGGGQRVKQIKMSDNWNAFSGESDVETGVEYDYTVEDPHYGTISSGVAQYEPKLGGDEIALRYPKYFVDNPPLKAKNHSYFEYPLNEGYFPSPSVGYSRVEVKSINTSTQMTNAETGDVDGIGTTGITEYAFYTAKDFPVLVKETDIIKAKFNIPIPIPFIGRFERKKIKAAQGYMIELNDMHGQAKSMKTYGLDATYAKSNFLTSSVEYTYNANSEHEMVVNSKYSKIVSRLTNIVETIDHDHIGETPITEKRLIGVEYDFFTDQRQNKSHTTIVGGHGNIDILPPIIPAPNFWPAFSSIKRDMKTFTTNKVIFKSGIISKVHTYDGQSKVVTENKVYDAQTGRPIITTVNNEFEDLTYKYQHPAHWEYNQMGGAYKNINLEFEAKVTDKHHASDGLDKQFIIESDDEVISQLVSGDELLGWYTKIEGGESVEKSFLATYLYVKDNDEGIIFINGRKIPTENHGQYLYDNRASEKCWFKVIRSGRRNHVFADAGVMVSKEMPVNINGTDPRTNVADIVESESVMGETMTFNVKRTRLDHVLNATAVVFKDEWESAQKWSGLESATDERNTNPYRTGEAGIWRASRAYTYVGDRTAGADPTVPSVPTDIRTNGEMNNVYLFNWQVPFYERYVPEWQWMSEITKYSEQAYELENIDRLGIKSAAIYAHDGSVVVGVGSNAGYHEIGAEDFERYNTGVSTSKYSQEEEDHLGFYNNDVTGNYITSSSRTYRILRGVSLADGRFKLELETKDLIEAGDIIELALQTSDFAMGGKSKAYLFSADVLTVAYTIDGTVHVEVKTRHHYESGSILSLLGLNKYITGRATITRNQVISFNNNAGSVSFVNGKAHTGKQSMKFNHAVTFPQGKLDLIKGKTYVFSAWVSRDDVRKIDFDGVDLKVQEWTGSWSNITDLTTFKKGRVIEGWQKIEFEFTPTVNDAVVAIYLKSSSLDTYIDDIRISPKTGGIITYVYDPVSFRLRAKLNANNYATLYFYDEEGNLHLVKQETERGIQTMTENRGHIKAGI